MSPIHGLSETRRLPRLGKIHLGEKVTNARGVEYPKATEYFVVPDEVAKIYGAQPTSLDIMFPVEDEAIFASQFYRAYSQTRGLVCKGDGERAARLIDVATKRGTEDTGEITGDIATAQAKAVEWVDDIPCPGQACPYYQKKQCGELMMLLFILPRVRGLGIWQLDTSSYHGMVNVNSTLAMIRQMFGRGSGIPLVLSLEPMEVAPEGKKKTVRVLQLRSRETMADMLKLTFAPLPELPSAVMPAAEDEVPVLLYPTEEERQAQVEDDQTTPETLLGFKEWAKDTWGYETWEDLCKDMGVEKPAQILTMHETWPNAVDYLASKHTEVVAEDIP